MFAPLRRAFATEAASARPNLHAAIVLNRAPLLTRTPTPFEKAFYAYQAHIHRAMRNPSPTGFYFKQSSPLGTRFNIEEKRCTFGAPFGVDPIEERNEAIELMEIAMKDKVDESMLRIHKADESNNAQNLNRRGQRNLCLLLKTRENSKDVWRFPQGDVQKGEFLHVSAGNPWVSTIYPNRSPEMMLSSFTKPIFSLNKLVQTQIGTKTLHG